MFRLRSRRPVRHRQEPAGINSFPSDQILDGLECDTENLINRGLLCVNVDGEVDLERDESRGNVQDQSWQKQFELGWLFHPEVVESQSVSQDTLYSTAVIIGIAVITLLFY
jgi:hypothetical protein